MAVAAWWAAPGAGVTGVLGARAGHLQKSILACPARECTGSTNHSMRAMITTKAKMEDCTPSCPLLDSRKTVLKAFWVLDQVLDSRYWDVSREKVEAE